MSAADLTDAEKVEKLAKWLDRQIGVPVGNQVRAIGARLSELEQRLASCDEARATANRLLAAEHKRAEEAALAGMETCVEYGHQTVELGWIPEHRGIKYASHQRTVHFRTETPLLIDHWSDPNNRKPFDPPVTTPATAVVTE